MTSFRLPYKYRLILLCMVTDFKRLPYKLRISWFCMVTIHPLQIDGLIRLRRIKAHPTFKPMLFSAVSACSAVKALFKGGSRGIAGREHIEKQKTTPDPFFVSREKTKDPASPSAMPWQVEVRMQHKECRIENRAGCHGKKHKTCWEITSPTMRAGPPFFGETSPSAGELARSITFITSAYLALSGSKRSK